MHAAPLQHNFSGRFRVAYPLRPAARGNQICLAVDLKQVHRRGVTASSLAPAHLQEPHVARRDSQANQESERAIEECFHRAGLAKGGQLDAVAHNYIVRPSLASVSERSFEPHVMASRFTAIAKDS